MARRQPGEPFAATWLAVAAVAVLAIAVGALSLFAYERAHPPAAAQSVAPVPTFGSAPAPTPSVAEPVEASPSPTLDRSTERFLSATTRAMWRGTAGACGAAEPLVERSTDGGRTWVDVTARYRQVAQLASLDAFTPTDGQLVAGVGPECQAQALRTFTQGQFWEPAQVLAASSFIALRDASQVVTPAGTIPAPCADATGLRSAGTRLGLVCDGEAYTLEAASSWQPAGIDDAFAIAFTDDGMLVAHGASSTCAGVSVSLVVGVDPPAPVGCAAGVDPSEGAIALATDGSKVLIWAGENIVDVTP